MGRPVILYSLGSSAILCTAISTIVNGVFAASFEHAVFGKALLAYMAVVLTAISSIALGLLLVSFTRNTARDRQFWKSWRGFTFTLLGGVLCITLVFVAIALRWCDSELRGEDATRIPRHTRELYSAWCGVWAVAIIFQILFYVCLALPPDYRTNWGSGSISSIASGTASFLRPKGRRYTRPTERRPSATVQSVASSEHKHPPSTPANSHHDPERKDSKSPLHSGPILPNSHILQHVQQHNSTHSDQQIQDSKPHKAALPLERSRSPLEQEHTFDQWDTSSVPRDICDALLQSTLQNTSTTNRNNKPNKKVNSINSYKPTPRPNSRASSFASTTTTIVPSKIYPQRRQSARPRWTPRKDSILPESPTLTSLSFSLPSSPCTCAFPYTPHFPSAPYLRQQLHQYPYDFYKPLPRPKFPPRQRAHSFEDHIHPLFRSSSPDPPPVTTRGTVVTASPVAGQTISKKALSRIKSGSFSSLPASSSPLAKAEVMVGWDVGGDGVDESE
ncbi:hypothetical protein GX50_08825, partial [[Emmonsia] crescens]